MEGAHKSKKLGNKKIKNIERLELENTPPEFMLKKIKNLEERMYQHARDLEFEEAAKLRDQIDFLQNNFLGFERSDIG